MLIESVHIRAGSLCLSVPFLQSLNQALLAIRGQFTPHGCCAFTLYASVPDLLRADRASPRGYSGDSPGGHLRGALMQCCAKCKNLEWSNRSDAKSS